MKTNIIFCIEDPSLLDKVLWNEFFKISSRKLERLIILSRAQKESKLLHKILMLQIRDIFYYIKLFYNMRSFNFDNIFRNIEHKKFKNNKQFNLWVKENLIAQDNLLVSVGCPFGTFWEKFLSEKNYSVTLHHISQGVDTGEIIMLKNLELSESDKSLFRIVLEKKFLGANMLQEYLSSEQICEDFAEDDGNVPAFSFPTFNQIFKLRASRYLNIFRWYN